MVRQTIALSRSCFIVQEYISRFGKQKNPPLCLSSEDPCQVQVLLPSCWVKNPNFCYFLGTLGVESSLCAALLVHTRVDPSWDTASLYQVVLPLVGGRWGDSRLQVVAHARC